MPRLSRRTNFFRMPKSAPLRKPARLADIQALMGRAVMRPLTASEGMQPTWGDGEPMAEVADRIIKPNDRLDSFERLQIYNQQYWWRLLASFAEDFRGLRAVLGQRKFDRLAVAYLEACGSTSWNLRNVGQHLVAYLGDHPELIAPHGDLAIEMTKVEWARVEAFDGPARPPIDPQRIAQCAPSTLRFHLQPYLTLLELRHPIDELLRKLRQRQIETGSASNATTGQRRRRTVRLTARPAHQAIFLAVHRVEFSVFYKRLEPEAWRLLELLRAGATLENACGEAFANSHDLPETNAERIRGWFTDWSRFGWLCERRGQGS